MRVALLGSLLVFLSTVTAGASGVPTAPVDPPGVSVLSADGDAERDRARRSDSDIELFNPSVFLTALSFGVLEGEYRNTNTTSGGPFPVSGVILQFSHQSEFGQAILEALFVRVRRDDGSIVAETEGEVCQDKGGATVCVAEVEIGNMQANEVFSFEIGVRGLSPGEQPYLISTTQNEFDPDEANNRANGIVIVEQPPTITGRKRLDRDGDGQEDDEDGPVDGVPIQLLDVNGTVIAETVTGPVDVNGDGTVDPIGERGIFEFPLPPPGMYTVVEPVPDGWQAIPAGGVHELEVGEIPIQGIDFVNIPPPPPDGRFIADWGDLPDSYSTTAAAGGPLHLVFFGQILLGVQIDVEPDGVPTDDASGDDRFVPPDQVDDEDGLVGIDFSDGSTGSLTVRTNAAGFLDAWLDFFDDGTFGALDHIVKAAPVPGAGEHTFTFTVPAGGQRGGYLRLRLHDVPGGLAPGGFAWNGEVEDHLTFGLDLGDANQDPLEIIPGMPFGYPVRISIDGARHLVDGLVRIGERVDAETDLDAALGAEVGLASNTATGDDNDPDDNENDGPRDDEDGVAFGDGFVPFTIQLPLGTADPSAPNALTRFGLVAGTTGTLTFFPNVDGGLDGWFDWNRDGDWDDDGEHVFANERIGPSNPPPTLDVTAPASAPPGFYHARFRFSRNGALRPVGLAPDGEVEDYLMATFPPLDYGDAPAPYPSGATDGARHGVGDVRLGSAVDAEVEARDDDGDDGVALPAELRRGRSETLSVTVGGGPASLYAWIDWNGDGDWDDDGEQVADGDVLAVGTHAVSVAVPAGAVPGTTWLRVRASRVALPFVAGHEPNALVVPFVTEGEVEDYPVEIAANAVDTEDAPIETALERVFPNPAADRLAVTVARAHAGPAAVRLVDALGRVVAHVEVPTSPGRHTVHLDVRRLAAGVYAVVLEADGVRQSLRAVVAR